MEGATGDATEENNNKDNSGQVESSTEPGTSDAQKRVPDSQPPPPDVRPKQNSRRDQKDSEYAAKNLIGPYEFEYPEGYIPLDEARKKDPRVPSPPVTAPLAVAVPKYTSKVPSNKVPLLAIDFTWRPPVPAAHQYNPENYGLHLLSDVADHAARLGGQSNKRIPPIMRFELRSLAIGAFQFLSGINDSSSIRIIFQKEYRVMTYEMQWVTEVVAATQKMVKVFAFIQVPLAMIDSIRVDQDILYIHLNLLDPKFPRPRVGIGTVPGEWIWTPSIMREAQPNLQGDVTCNHLSVWPQHAIKLKQREINILKEALFDFLPILNIIDQLAVNQLPLHQTTTSGSGCRCAKGCDTKRCSCTSNAYVCSERCSCQKTNVTCQNPFKVLGGEWRICLIQLRSDPCLCSNVKKIRVTQDHLDTLILLPCCGSSRPLRLLVPGKRPCPGLITSYDDQLIGSCDRFYEYSWCNGTLHETTTNPRNHCEICQLCAGRNAHHCPQCNKCTLRTSAQPLCSTCFPVQ